MNTFHNQPAVSRVQPSELPGLQQISRDVFIPLFDRVIWLWLPADIRVAGIRERLRYGAERVGPGGDLDAVYEKNHRPGGCLRRAC
jgi:hypothetical protein